MEVKLKGYLLFLIGLCAVHTFSQSDIQALGILPQNIGETSGLIYYNDKLITHNDSGNAPELYELNVETLQVTRTIKVRNAENIDWEDIAQDTDYIYVGDIGNNNGHRQDLNILRISKAEFDTNDEVVAERIDFLYEDQMDFMATENSDFDAEALFVLNDDLIILTKQWQAQGTTAYRVPKKPGTFLAEPMATYQVNGLVTGADFDASSNTLYLIGYSTLLAPFFVEIPEVGIENIFGSGQNKSNLSIGIDQVEALAYNNGVFYVTSEEFVNPPLVNSLARLFSFSLDDMMEDVPNPKPEDNDTPIEGLLVFKSANSSVLNYELNTNKPIFGMGIFDIQGKMVSYVPLERISEAHIDISTLSQGLYHLAFFYDNRAISSPFYRD